MRVDQARRLRELEVENTRLKKIVADLSLDNSILKEAVRGKLLSPAKKSRGVQHVCERQGISQRRACQALHQPRSTQRHVLTTPDDEERSVDRIGDYR